jgi:CRISPR-associated exonuclease Cas4
LRPLELNVTDIRQHVYCLRIPYYRYTLPLERPVTAKIRQAEFEEYLELLRAEYKRKRNFMKLLEQIE